MQTIIPILRYREARRAIGWLREAFGFELLFSVPASGAYVRHARLTLSGNQVMVGTVREEDTLSTPPEQGGVTQGLYVFVEDVEAHFQQAKAAGATILLTPQDTDFGAREYHAEDLEGHPWVFGSHLPETA